MNDEEKKLGNFAKKKKCLTDYNIFTLNLTHHIFLSCLPQKGAISGCEAIN